MKPSILKTILLALTLHGTASLAQAEQFTLLIYETKADLAARTDKEKAPDYWAAYGGFAKALADAGVMRGGTALPGNAGSKTVRTTAGKIAATDAPVAASELELGGYFIIEVADLAAAVDWARKVPGIATGAVEVKPHAPNPTMPAK